MCQVKAIVQVAKTVFDKDVAGTAGFSSCDHVVIVGTKLIAGPCLFEDALFQVNRSTLGGTLDLTDPLDAKPLSKP